MDVVIETKSAEESSFKPWADQAFIEPSKAEITFEEKVEKKTQ